MREEGTPVDRIPVLACNPSAMDAEQRSRHSRLAADLRARVREVVETPEGYAFRLDGGGEVLLWAAEFVSLERLCCPFVDFGLRLEADEGPLWLRLGGRAGVKEVLAAELGLDRLR